MVTIATLGKPVKMGLDGETREALLMEDQPAALVRCSNDTSCRQGRPMIRVPRHHLCGPDRVAEAYRHVTIPNAYVSPERFLYCRLSCYCDYIED
jgi:hypothetical protein